MLERETGKPVFGVEERPVPKRDAEGEEAFPDAALPIGPTTARPAAALGGICLGSDPAGPGRMPCPDREAAVGGGSHAAERAGTIASRASWRRNWSSGAFDPERRLIVSNVNNSPMEVHLIPHDKYQESERAATRRSVPRRGFASAWNTYGMSRQLAHVVQRGALQFTPMEFPSRGRFGAGDNSLECNLGDDCRPFRDSPRVIHGTPNFGEPIVTAGGLVFIASAMDDHLRAFDFETGAELWKGRFRPGPSDANDLSPAARRQAVRRDRRWRSRQDRHQGRQFSGRLCAAVTAKCLNPNRNSCIIF